MRLASPGKLLLFFALAALAAAPAAAQISTPASNAVLMDYESGEVLFCQDCDQRMPPSSMSKLITVELVFQRLKDGRLQPDDTFHVSERAWRQGLTDNESKMWVADGSDVRVDDLLKGIIVVSGGDACVVVAEALGGSEAEFAEMANRRAAELGLTNSHFVNSHGLPDPAHYMSARDLGALSAHIIREYPDYYQYFAIPEFTWSNIRQPNRNRLLFTNAGVDGLKTGHTEAGGYGIVASAQRDGRRLIAVVNGLGSEAQRNTEAGRLLNIGFREFRSYELLAAGAIAGEAEVWGGASATVPITVAAPLRAILTPEARRQMQVTLRYDGPIAAPIAAGQEIGTLTVSAPGRPDRSFPVIAAEEVPVTGVFGYMLMGLNALIGGL